ncbi:MAG: hypothetical protein ACK52I_07945 [Pseudomonadota bacterium]
MSGAGLPARATSDPHAHPARAAGDGRDSAPRVAGLRDRGEVVHSPRGV